MHGSAEPSSPVAGIGDDQIAYTVKRAAQVLDLSERMLWQLVMDGEIGSIKVGRARRIPRVELVAFVERRAG